MQSCLFQVSAFLAPQLQSTLFTTLFVKFTFEGWFLQCAFKFFSVTYMSTGMYSTNTSYCQFLNLQ